MSEWAMREKNNWIYLSYIISFCRHGAEGFKCLHLEKKKSKERQESPKWLELFLSERDCEGLTVEDFFSTVMLLKLSPNIYIFLKPEKRHKNNYKKWQARRMRNSIRYVEDVADGVLWCLMPFFGPSSNFQMDLKWFWSIKAWKGERNGL